MRSEGCRLCHLGAKLVLFITGRCGRDCWYCPLSAERRGTDLVWANDRTCDAPQQAVDEARVMSALGTGITGGEPLLVPDRVVEYASALKEEFGADHHIHLYTGAVPSSSLLRRLRGRVDELRFHPPEAEWDRILDSPYLGAAREAVRLGFAAGFEVPSLPGVTALEAALPYLQFLNINELEWGETSAGAMRDRGLEPVDGLHNAVRGSGGWARGIRHRPGVHFCSSRFKDSVQLRERLKRIARNTARPFDQVTGDGTIRYGVVEGSSSAGGVRLKAGSFQVFPDHLELSCRDLKQNRRRLPGRKYIVERYPNGGVVVEVTPL